MKELLISLYNYNIKPVEVNEKEAVFDEGYETYDFYNAVLSCVKEKLYIYGRKNRKLFTKNNTRIKELLNNNVDFKCLFLSDKASFSILKMAQENEKFENDLKKVINNVKEKYTNYLNCFKKYDFQQLKRVIILDDAVIYAPVEFENGSVKHFTKSKFMIYDIDSAKAIDLMHEFNKIWDLSNPL